MSDFFTLAFHFFRSVFARHCFFSFFKKGIFFAMRTISQ